MNRVFTVLCALFWLLPVALADNGARNPLALIPRTGAVRPTDEVLKASGRRLCGEFDEWLKDPNAYRQRALRECKPFPEGRIYPFAIPAIGYANVGLGNVSQRKHSAEQMRKLINDTNRLSVLARQLQFLPDYLRLLEKGGQGLFDGQVEVSSQYLTGFLYGDAVLFYAVTWAPYPAATKGTSKSTPKNTE